MKKILSSLLLRYNEYIVDWYLRYIKLYRWIKYNSKYSGVIPINFFIYKMIGINQIFINKSKKKIIYPADINFNNPKSIGFQFIKDNHYYLQKKSEYLLYMSNVELIGANAYPIYKNKVLFEITRDNYIKEIINKQDKIININELTFINAGQHSDNYFHFIIDMLSRFRFIENMDKSKYPQKFIIRTEQKFQLQYLELMGIDIGKIISPKADTIYKIKEAIIPSYSSLTRWGFPNPEDIFYLRSKLINKGCKLIESYKKIYISRKNATQGRKIINEDKIIKNLEKYNIEVLYLENYSVKEQISIFNNAELIIAPHGAGLTNTIYCNMNCVIIEFISPYHFPPYFDFIYRALGLRTFYIKGSKISENSDLATQDYSVSLEKIENCLNNL